MSQQALVALIAAVGALIGAAITAFTAARSLRLEHRRFSSEQSRRDVEVEKLRLEIQNLAKDMNSSERAKRVIEDALIEFEKKNLANVLETRTATYPQLLELVYRIRNQARSIRSTAWEYTGTKYLGWREAYLKRFIEASRGDQDGAYIKGLWQLTENLYRYKIFIDAKTWEHLHHFKHVVQDLALVLDRVLRPRDSSADEIDRDNRSEVDWELNIPLTERLDESKPTLERLFQQIDSLHDEITDGLRKHFDMVIQRNAPETLAEGLAVKVSPISTSRKEPDVFTLTEQAERSSRLDT